jgi:hypothetical protein
MKPYWSITLVYLIFGLVWIVSTDFYLYLYFDDSLRATLSQTAKGILFVTLSTLLIFIISKRAFERHELAKVERTQLFIETIQASNHILRNYLNQMQLVTMEAERCELFNQDALKIAKEISFKAEEELQKLSQIELVSPETIAEMTYPR